MPVTAAVQWQVRQQRRHVCQWNPEDYAQSTAVTTLVQYTLHSTTAANPREMQPSNLLYLT
jgi:hypothetical protein